LIYLNDPGVRGYRVARLEPEAGLSFQDVTCMPALCLTYSVHDHEQDRAARRGFPDRDRRRE
jgi:hypothetical protein